MLARLLVFLLSAVFVAEVRVLSDSGSVGRISVGFSQMIGTLENNCLGCYSAINIF